jgi:hypothetical protein
MVRALPTQSRINSKAWSQRGLSDAIKWEVLSVADESVVTLTFESAASSGQGVWLPQMAGSC